MLSLNLFNEQETTITRSDIYFNNTYEDEWLDDPLIKEIISDVDKSKVISPHLIDSPVLGPIGPKELSGGTKTLILMLKDREHVFDLSNCGDNCAKWAIEIGKTRDRLLVDLGYWMDFGSNAFEIHIANNNKIVHNMYELTDVYAEVDDFGKETKEA